MRNHPFCLAVKLLNFKEFCDHILKKAKTSQENLLWITLELLWISLCKASIVMQNLIKKDNILSTLEEIKLEICQKFDFIFSDLSKLKVSSKADNTIVTEIDLFVSNLVKDKFIKKYPFLNFFSEEDQENFAFPMIILDPIDGTRELSQGINECAVSFGVYFSEDFSDKRNFSWIFNPFTGFVAKSEESIPPHQKILGDKLFAYVSNTEFNKGLHVSNDLITYLPKGSIAFKLGLLATGTGNFVISRKPKNIWDIMAGTHICYERGIYLYNNGQKVTSLNSIKVENDLVWASEEAWEKIKNSL